MWKEKQPFASARTGQEWVRDQRFHLRGPMLSLHLMPQKKNESPTVSAQKGESSGFCQDSHAKLL